MATNPSIIELFAGCGGMALGMHRAGFAHTLMIEVDHDAWSTLESNWGCLPSPAASEHETMRLLQCIDINRELVRKQKLKRNIERDFAIAELHRFTAKFIHHHPTTHPDNIKKRT